jgi:hypothetical protein
MSGRKGSIDWQYEFEGDLVLSVIFHGDSDYHWTPGDPGCRYTRNGDGWPPTDPEVEFFNHRVTELEIATAHGSIKIVVDKTIQTLLGDEIFAQLDLDDLTDKANQEVEQDEPEYTPDGVVDRAIRSILDTPDD